MSRARLHRRLDRVGSAPASVLAATGASNSAARSPAGDERLVAVELARSFGSLVAHYRELYGLSPEDARARAGGTRERCVDRALGCDPSRVGWFNLNTSVERDPERAEARWEEVEDAARGEVASGHWAARALERYESHCWRRARFLAIRSELAAGWWPRTAAEQHLIDQMAQWQDLVWR